MVFISVEGVVRMLWAESAGLVAEATWHVLEVAGMSQVAWRVARVLASHKVFRLEDASRRKAAAKTSLVPDTADDVGARLLEGFQSLDGMAFKSKACFTQASEEAPSEGEEGCVRRRQW